MINNVILNGFDRCGSSAISRVLGNHPDIELLFQPFNSGSIRKKMYQVFDEKNVSKQDISFFKQLEKGVLDNDYIVSHWHRKFSTVQNFSFDKLHIIKTTINHFTAEWLNNNFPHIEQWGIWRNPIQILASIERNNFYNQWYSDAIKEITPTIKKSDLLAPLFAHYLDKINTVGQATALLIAVRNYYYFYHIRGRKVLIYENFSKQPTEELNKLCRYFKLKTFNFDGLSSQDFNVSGKKFEKNKDHSSVLDKKDLKFAQQIFEPLEYLYANKIINGSKK